VSFLTGQYVKTHRQYGFRGMQRPDLPHLFTHARDHGYRVGTFGKQHIHTLRDWGVERAATTLWEEQDRAVPESHTYASYLAAHGLSFPTDETHGGPDPEPRPDDGCARIPDEHNLETWAANETIRYLREVADGDSPFLAWLTFDRPHHPVTLPPGWFDKVDPSRVDIPRRETLDELLAKPRPHLWAIRDELSHYGDDDADFAHLLARYFVLIELIDHQIGRVLDALDELGLSDTTHVVFCADHGDNAGEQRIFDKTRGASADAVMRIPAIWAPTAGCVDDAVRGTTLDAPIEAIDFAPTFCELMGLAELSEAEGRSFAGAFRGEAMPMDRAVFGESYWRKAVVKGRYRLVHHVGRSLHELYDLEADPYEYRNLYEVAGHEGAIDELKHELIRWLAPPFDEDDVAHFERHILSSASGRAKLSTPRRPLGVATIGPAMIEGRGFCHVQDGPWELIYRLDGRPHALYETDSDPAKEVDRIADEAGERAYPPLRDALLDLLSRRVPPISVIGPDPPPLQRDRVEAEEARSVLSSEA
jgi:arylsulfatase A-like enzyme